MKRRLISVTAKDIAKGIRKNCETCPIARALSRAFQTPDVGVGIAALVAKCRVLRLSPSDRARVQFFILGFDMGERVDQFRFYVS